MRIVGAVGSMIMKTKAGLLPAGEMKTNRLVERSDLQSDLSASMLICVKRHEMDLNHSEVSLRARIRMSRMACCFRHTMRLFSEGY